jgi:hypothetical protein
MSAKKQEPKKASEKTCRDARRRREWKRCCHICSSNWERSKLVRERPDQEGEGETKMKAKKRIETVKKANKPVINDFSWNMYL